MDEEKHNNESVAQIIQNADGKYNVSMLVASTLERKRRRSIESKTETTIKMPCEKSEGKIEVFGSTRSAVELAMKEIEKVVAQKNRGLTHFLSIPIDDKGIVERFVQFKNEVMSMNTTDGTEAMTDEYFQKTYKLHLTFGVLDLFNDERKKSALQVLQECKEIVASAKNRFNEPGDLRIKISGVNCMNENPSKCKILYGMVENELLQTIADEIVGRLISKGLIDEDKNKVKLHVTMINVIFVTRITKNRRKSFDASTVMEKYSNYEFGEQTIDQIHLSRFERSGEGAYYQPEDIVNISDANASTKIDQK